MFATIQAYKKRGKIHMARKPQTIYQYFNEYSEELIDKVISNLSTDEKYY